jgi:hypothetical protein
MKWDRGQEVMGMRFEIMKMHTEMREREEAMSNAEF